MLAASLRRLVAASVARPRATLVAHLLLLIAALALGGQRFWGSDGLADARLRLFDNSLQGVWGEDVAAIGRYQAFQQDFGSDELIAYAVRGPGALDGAALRAVAGYAAALSARPEGLQVAWAGSLPYAPESIEFGETPTSEEVAAFLAAAAQDPTARRFVRADGEGWDLALLITLPPQGRDDAARLALSRALDEVWRAQSPPSTWTAAGTGSPELLGGVYAASLETVIYNLPVVNALVALLCLVVFRRLKLVVAAFAALAQGEILALALFLGTGHSLNYVSGFMLTCIVVVGFATNIHLLTRYNDERRRGGPREALAASVGSVAGPTTLALVSNGVGFLSMGAAAHDAIASFGVFSALGMALVMLCTFTLSPAFLALFDQAPVQWRPLRLPSVVPLSRWCWDRAPAVLAACAVIAAVSAAGLRRLEVGSSVRESFVPSSPFSADIRAVSERFPGLSPFELVVRWPEGGPAEPAAFLREVAGVERAVGAALALPDEAMVSAADVARSFCLAPGKAELCEGDLPKPETAAALFEEGIHPAGLTTWRRAEGRFEARITLLLDLPYAQEGVALAARATDAAQAASPGARAEITGLTPLWGEMEAGIVEELLGSFALGYAAVLLMLGLALRSLRATLLSILPNTLPLLAVTGLAGFAAAALGLHVTSSAMMYLTIAVGIIVDETVFFLTGYRDQIAAGRSGEDALAETLREAGSGTLLTCVCLCLGFASLASAGITNIQVMGALTSAAIAAALLGYLAVLPALCRLFWNPSSPTEDTHVAHPARRAA